MTSETSKDDAGADVTLPSLFKVEDGQSHPVFDVETVVAHSGYVPATDWTISEAFLCLILSAAAADGVVPPEEHMEIQALARRSRVLKSVGSSGLARLNATLAERLKQRPHGLQEACGTLPSDMRLSIFAHCADIVLADGALSRTEAQFLNRITAYLELQEDDARRVVEMLLIKNRY